MDEPAKIEGDVELKPRGYQTQIENVALHQNTIIYLPTGSGKTFIAIQLIKRLQHLTTKPFSEGGQRTFFLVNTVPLVNQHKTVIEQLTPLNVKGFTSQDNVDLWKENEWNQQLEDAQVIILTSQILLDMLLHGYIEFSKINLIIFDECHIAVDNHPMRQILGFLQDVPDKHAPRIIGLTATLLNKSIRIEDLESTIKELETTLNSKICTSDLTEEVLNCSTSPNEFVVIFEKYSPTEIDEVVLRELCNLDMFLELLLPTNKSKGASKLKGYDTINAEPKTFRNLKKICSLVKRSFLDMGIFGGSISLLAAIIKLERMKIKASYENQPVIQSMITRMTKARGFLQNQMSAYQGYEQIEKFSSSKILSLLNILLEYSPNYDKNKCFKRHNSPICCIIFVKERKSSLVLSMLLNQVIKSHWKFNFLKHDFVTGFNVTPFNDTRESLYEKKKNSITLAKFNHGLLNCLISTEILEEGYDLPKCNLVIRYDEMFSFRGYIQSKGRGRHSDASYVILVSRENHAQTTQKLEEFQNILTKLDELLIGKTEDRSSPTEDEVADAFKKYYEPYKFNNATITINSSISLLNRYCSILPHDIYTIPQPIWSKKKRDNFVAMAVQMPVNCPVKISAESPFVENIKSAKQIAALEMCKCLHKAGELDDNLLPAVRSKMVFNEQNNNLLFSHWPKMNNDKVSSSSSINELYEKKFPQCFLRDYDQDTFYLQFIKITPLLSPTYEHNEEINELLNYPNSFGIITPKKMDKICSFPLFISSGEVLIDIETQYSEVKIADNEVPPLVRFHHMILFDVIGCNQRFVIYDPYKLYNFFLIVPTRLMPHQEKYEIDWESINKYSHFEDYYTPTFEQRGSINVTKENYQHSVVMPWYRGPISCKYLVTDVLEDLTPNSPFPNDNYGSFADYYEDKYKLTIVGPKNQSLLRVVPIGGKMNCLVPRTATLEKYISKKKQKAMHCDNEQPGMPVYDEKLIPEFCIKYEFPGTLWLKAMLLPSIIHRITMLLIADELRQKIAIEAGIGSVHQSGDASWDQMILDNYAIQKFNLQKLREDSPEFPPNTDFEDVNPNVNDDPKRSTLDVSYEVTKNKIDHNYPWKPCIEPVDIYRQPETISVMDIECYERFVNEPVTFQSCDVTTDHNTSIEPVFSKRAICAPPQKLNDTIQILKRKPSKMGPKVDKILEALTISKSNDILNLERCETLGDSFLKYAASLYTWSKFATYDEGQLTAIKSKIVSNRNLFYCAKLIDLGGRMKASQFKAKSDWLLPCFSVPPCVSDVLIDDKDIANAPNLNLINLTTEECLNGQLTEESIALFNNVLSDVPKNNSIASMEMYFGKQTVKEKSVADSMESLIGVYLLDSGIETGFDLLRYFHILPCQNDLPDLLTKKIVTPFSSNTTSYKEINFQLDHCISNIEKIFNYKFKDPSLLLEALSHSSNLRNNITGCYQRLEFIGDAILDFLITCYIFENFPSLNPGDITDLRSALVNNVTFACIVVRHGLHKYILSSNVELDCAINKFANFQSGRNHVVDEAVLFLLEEDNCYLSNYVDVPKVLGDIFESLAGAIYLDSGNDLSVVWKLYNRLLHQEIEEFGAKIPKQPVRVLYEKVHSSPVFLESKETTNGRIMVPLTFLKKGQKKVVHGFGFNRPNAKRSAAKMALKMLNDIDM